MKLLLILFMGSLQAAPFDSSFHEKIRRLKNSLVSCGFSGTAEERNRDCMIKNGIKPCIFSVSSTTPEQKAANCEEANKSFHDYERDELGKDFKSNQNLISEKFFFTEFPHNYRFKDTDKLPKRWRAETKNKKRYNLQGFSIVTIDTYKRIYWLDNSTGFVWSPVLDVYNTSASPPQYINDKTLAHEADKNCLRPYNIPGKSELTDALENGLGEVWDSPEKDFFFTRVPNRGGNNDNQANYFYDGKTSLYFNSKEMQEKRSQGSVRCVSRYLSSEKRDNSLYILIEAPENIVSERKVF